MKRKTNTKERLDIASLPEVLTPRQVSQLFGIMPATLWGWSQRGTLNPVRINKRVLRYRRADVLGLLNVREVVGVVA